MTFLIIRRFFYVSICCIFFICAPELKGQGTNEQNFSSEKTLEFAIDYSKSFPIQEHFTEKLKINNKQEAILKGYFLLESIGNFHCSYYIKSRKQAKCQLIINFKDENNEIIYRIDSTIVFGKSLRLQNKLNTKIPLGITFYTKKISIEITPILNNTISNEEIRLKGIVALENFEKTLIKHTSSEKLFLHALKFLNEIIPHNTLYRPTTTELVPQSFFLSSNLKDVKTHIDNGLDSCGYSSRRYYYFPYGNGFVIALEMEAITKKGKSKNKLKVKNQGSDMIESFNITAFLEAFFFGTKGYSRLMLIIVSDKNIPWEEKTNINEDEITTKIKEVYSKGGDWIATDEMSNRIFKNEYNCILAVYEFKKSNLDKAPRLLWESLLKNTKLSHLKTSKILQSLQLLK